MNHAYCATYSGRACAETLWFGAIIWVDTGLHYSHVLVQIIKIFSGPPVEKCKNLERSAAYPSSVATLFNSTFVNLP